jgi:hypothetical protein
MLHDLRTRNCEEAILWHFGDAEQCREKFRNLSKSDRNALIKFLEAIKTVQSYEKQNHNLLLPSCHACYFDGGDIYGAVQRNGVCSKPHLRIMVVHSNMVYYRSQCVGLHYPAKNAQTADSLFAARFVFGDLARSIFDVHNQQTGYNPATDGETV